jgi:hypothetical protein
MVVCLGIRSFVRWSFGVATQLLPERDDLVLPFKGWDWSGKEWNEGQVAEEQSCWGCLKRMNGLEGKGEASLDV